MATTDQAIELADGPWVGMIDSISPTAKAPGKYLLLQNAYPLDPAIGDGIVGRPGVRVMGAQLGSVGRRRVQGHFQYTKKDGTEYTISVVGGYFYTLDWVNEVWTEVVTNAQLTAATITLDQTAKIAFTVISNKLHVSDGVNVPWLWDGTTGGGLTKLVNSPVLYGQPTLHQARIFGIKAIDPATMVWSNADDATTGYEAGGYSFAWTITQTDPNRLYRLHGTNEGIYVIRARSATTAVGDVSATFSSQSTKEGLSETVGTISPFAVVATGTTLIILDPDLHPQMLRAGAAGFTPAWAPFRETLKNIPKTPAMAYKCMAVDYYPAHLVLMAVPDLGATECNMLIVYDAKGATPVPVAVWRGWEMTSLAIVKSAATAKIGQPTLFHGDTLGYVYQHGNPEDSTPWDDFLSTGTVPITHILETQALGYSEKREKIFDRIDVAIRALTRMTLNISTISPRGKTTPQTITVDSGIQGWDQDIWDTMLWDVDVSVSTQEAHGDVGIDVQARWIKTRITHATLNEQFGLVGLTVLGYSTDDDPAIP